MVLFRPGQRIDAATGEPEPAHDKLELSPLFMAALLIVPPVVVAIFTPGVGYWSELWGRKPFRRRAAKQRDELAAPE
jgi:hypothetical protein